MEITRITKKIKFLGDKASVKLERTDGGGTQEQCEQVTARELTHAVHCQAQQEVNNGSPCREDTWSGWTHGGCAGWDGSVRWTHGVECDMDSWGECVGWRCREDT